MYFPTGQNLKIANDQCTCFKLQNIGFEASFEENTPDEKQNEAIN